MIVAKLRESTSAVPLTVWYELSTFGALARHFRRRGSSSSALAVHIALFQLNAAM